MNYEISSSQNTFGLPNNKYGLVDKQKQGVGLTEVNLETDTPQVTERDNIMMFDTRDCYGELSLREAQIAFSYDAATNGKIEPERFKQSLNPDGIVVPQKLVNVVQQMQNEGLISGMPERKNDEIPYVKGNIISFRLNKILKHVKSLEIINAIIPRDIIPVYVYFPGFINNCIPFSLPGTGVTYINPNTTDASSVWESPVIETIEDFFDSKVEGISSNKLGGVLQTPLRYWRSYTGPNCMSNPHTPPPYQLWNPPQDSFSDKSWPFQPQPVRGQRVPSYVAKNGVVFSGYGLYDLDDFPVTQKLQLADGTNIQIPLRKLILKLIVPEGQYIEGVSARNLIDISNIDDFNDSGIVDNPLTQTGYGDYQRFIPGPGLAMNYQPNQWRDGKSAPIDLSCSTYDPDTGYIGPMPVPFPNFRGNVWGPYGRPGDRFQNKSLQLTVDELYLNGDLENLEGNSIIWPNYNPSEGPYTFELFVTNLKRANNPVRFRTVQSASNPNIRNAMRVEYDGGFGAVYAYVGINTSLRGGTGPIISGGLPNTQYDGSFHKFNSDIWITPREDIPGNWIQSLPGPQKPTIVSGENFNGWIYVWRDVFPWTGRVYVPITAGGTGPMEYYDCDPSGPEWKKSIGSTQDVNLTYGSSQWSCSPVIGQSNFYCIPSSNPSLFEFVANVPYGQALSLELMGGGSNYVDSIDGFPGFFPRFSLKAYDENLTITNTIEITSVDSRGTVLSANYIDGPQTDDLRFADDCGPPPPGPPTFCVNPAPVKLGSGWAATVPIPGLVVNHVGGSDYNPANNLLTVTDNGTGSGLTIDIITVKNVFGINGVIETFVIRDNGSGYQNGDIVRVLQRNSKNNATFRITSIVPIPENLIPENNIFHYTDPLAVGPSRISEGGATVKQNYKNGVDTCTIDCPDNCKPPIGEFEYCVGNVNADAATACNDPRPLPDPPCMLKCDFQAQISPENEWNNDINSGVVNCRPLDNIRSRQLETYIDRRVSYNDLGSNNGYFIPALVNYRSFFVSSTPDTDLIIKIRQAERNIYTQSLNPQVDQSNFYIPIRLNLGTTSGTLEYVEAVQGTLTSSGVYWKKDYYPPKAQLGELELSLWTYDGTPVPVERSLGFIEQFTDQAILFSSSIASSFILHGSYSAFAPNLPPFATTNSDKPSSVIITGNNNSKTLSDPFNPKLERYTQRNLGLMFKMITYQGQNPGITEIIKKMPDNLIIPTTETFTDSNGNEKTMIPLASNIDEYGL